MRVLDLSQQLPGPYATLLLASLGANVTKIEPWDGDPARHLDPAMFSHVNAGKQSIVLDLKSAAGRSRLHDLVRQADVFVEGFRPGVTQRLGCDYTTLRAIREQIVYCSISGFGQTGPLAMVPSHDLSLQAAVNGLPQQVIDRIGVPWVDLGVGTMAALTIVSYWQRGTGAYLDMAMLDVARSWSWVKPEAVSMPEPTYGTVATRDGRLVAIALLEDSMWLRLCEALGWEDWLKDPDLRTYASRRREAARVRSRLDQSISALDLDRVLELGRTYDLPFSAVGADQDPQIGEQLATRLSPGHPPWQGVVPLPAANQVALSAAPPWTDKPNQ